MTPPPPPAGTLAAAGVASAAGMAAPALDPRKAAAAVALSVAIIHGMNDAYIAFLHPLLPRIMEAQGLSIALATTLGIALSISSSLLQPAMGLMADRYGRRIFIVAGPILAGVFLSLIGFANSFWVLLLFLLLGGVGSAAFHPPGASMAVRVGEGGGSGARYSFFAFGGAVGYAIGPLAAVGLVAWLGTRGLALAMIPVLVYGAWIWPRLPQDGAEFRAATPPSPREVLRRLRGPLGLIFGISAVGAFVQRVFLTMQPIMIHESGGAEALGALSLSAYLAGQAAGTLLGGRLTDRSDRRSVLIWLSILSVPAHLGALFFAPASVTGLAVTAVAGGLGMAMLPPIVVMAQELVPSGAGMVSGVVMGMAWAVGGTAVLATGVLGDLWGAQPAALVSVPIMFLGALFGWWLPRPGDPTPRRWEATFSR